MSHTLRAFFTVAAALAIGLPVSAQQTLFAEGDADAPMAVSMETSSIIPGPSMASAALAVPAVPQVAFDSSFDAALVAMAQPSRQNTTLMIIGGAAIVVGAVIGGDAGTIFMVGGGVIGLIGLYRHLQ